jgi:hypothetical protein
MATDSRKKFGILIGGGVVAAVAVVFFGFIWPPSGGTEGAIGQRQVYRDGSVKAADVSVTPGSAPTVIKTFLQGKQFHETARKDGFTQVDTKEFTALTENAEFLSFLATPGLATFLGNPLFPKVIQVLRTQPKGTKWTLQMLQNGMGPDAVKSPAYNELIRNKSFQRFMDNPAAPEILSNPVFQQLMEHPPLTRMVAIVQPNSLFLNPTNNEAAMSNITNSNTVNSATTNSNTVNSATTNSNTVNSAPTNMSTVGSNTVNSAIVGSNTVNSATTNSNFSFSNTVNSAITNSNTVNSATTNSNTANSAITNSNTVNSATTNSNTANSAITSSNTVNSAITNSNTANSQGGGGKN